MPPSAELDRSPREGLWFAQPREIAESYRPHWLRRQLIGYLVVAPCWFSCSSFGSGQTTESRLLIASAIIAGLLAWDALNLWVQRCSLRKHRGEDLSFIDRPLEAGELPVEVIFNADSSGLGSDRGVLWLQDGLLHFHGAATSFVLGPQDVVPRTRFGANDPYRRLPKDALRLRTRGLSAYIRIAALGGTESDVEQTIQSFLKSPPNLGTSRQWPPLRGWNAAPEDEEPEESPLRLDQG